MWACALALAVGQLSSNVTEGGAGAANARSLPMSKGTARATEVQEGVLAAIFGFCEGSKACVIILPLLTCYRMTGPLRGVEPLI